MRLWSLLGLVLAMLLTACSGCGGEDDPKSTTGETTKKPPVVRKKERPRLGVAALDETLYYPLDTCLGCPKKLDPRSHNEEVDGRLIRTCCDVCAELVKKDKAKAFARIDKAYLEGQLKRYPLKECAVPGCHKSLGDGAVDFLIDHHHRLIRVCDEDHKKAVLGDAEVYKQTLARVDAALKNDQWPADYEKTKTTQCAVNEKNLDDGQKAEPNGGYQKYLLQDRLIMTCCRTCLKLIQLQNYKGYVHRARGIALQEHKELKDIAPISVFKYGYPPVENCCKNGK